MGFTKLDEGILDSSIMAADPVTFKIWIALLAKCQRDGIARVAAPGLAAVCHLQVEEVRKSLEFLSGPDPDSRTPTADGRRIERCDGGWRLINYQKYRREGLRAAESEARSDRRNRPEGPDKEGTVRTEPGVSGPGPDLSASASASASEEGGEGGGVKPFTPEERLEFRSAVWEAWVAKRGPGGPDMSNAEWVLVCRWMNVGWPLRIVLRGIKDCSEGNITPTTTLFYVEPAVVEAAKRWRKTA